MMRLFLCASTCSSGGDRLGVWHPHVFVHRFWATYGARGAVGTRVPPVFTGEDEVFGGPRKPARVSRTKRLLLS